MQSWNHSTPARRSVLRALTALTALGALASPVRAYAVTCGQLLTESVTLTDDLDCTGVPNLGAALALGEDGVVLDGAGHTIRIDSAYLGVVVSLSGKRVTIRNLKIAANGSTRGIRIGLGPESPPSRGVVISGITFLTPSYTGVVTHNFHDSLVEDVRFIGGLIGMAAYDGASGNTYRGNLIEDYGYYGIITAPTAPSANGPRFVNNTFRAPPGGFGAITLIGEVAPAFSGNVFQTDTAIRLQDATGAVLSDIDFTGSTVADALILVDHVQDTVIRRITAVRPRELTAQSGPSAITVRTNRPGLGTRNLTITASRFENLYAGVFLFNDAREVSITDNLFRANNVAVADYYGSSNSQIGIHSNDILENRYSVTHGDAFIASNLLEDYDARQNYWGGGLPPNDCTRPNCTYGRVLVSPALESSALDRDADGLVTWEDNCPAVANADQADLDRDSIGDACDLDQDGDGVLDPSDTCPRVAAQDQRDTDRDGLGDPCDADDDQDGIGDDLDNCPLAANPFQEDGDLDGAGDACDVDVDGDGVPNEVDNCPFVANPDQVDTEDDGAGDACDPDADGDGRDDGADNCPTVANQDQLDTDHDAIGDACDADDDQDGIADEADNCPLTANSGQANADSDALGDACDPDDDGDLVPDSDDNCPLARNGDQANADSDGLGDACDPDDDDDGRLDGEDNCPRDANTDQADADHDGAGDACDPDDDGDGDADDLDDCPYVFNPDQADLDGDGTGDACDGDVDGDGVANAADNCPARANGDQYDLDGDGDGDVCDEDLDGDTIANASDDCPAVANRDQADADGDGAGDACDPDDDNDGVGDAADNCRFTANPSQADFDGDALGDACDPDADGDRVANERDLCPFTPAGAAVEPRTGCSIAQLCPCSAPRGQSAPWPNHGQYASCVARSAESLVAAGAITGAEKDALVAAAARSTCGKR